jgi:diguanylate cyclase (GGDEF)-like protein
MKEVNQTVNDRNASGRRKTPWGLVCWPLAAICATALMWLDVETFLASQKDKASRDAFKNASSLSRSYSEQLIRSIEQIDQITLNIKFHWEQFPGTVELEKQFKAGLYGTASLFFVTIVDRHGKVVTSTLKNSKTDDISKTTFFTTTRIAAGKDLVIARPEMGPRSGKLVVRFSRRLEAPDGGFDGLVIVGVRPDFLVAFNDETSMGPSDFLSLWDEGGTLIASKTGERARLSGSVFQQLPLFSAREGSVKMPATEFWGNEPRLVAWNRLDRGLVSVVGLSEYETLASYHAMAATYRQVAAVATALLFILSLFGIRVMRRISTRKRQAEEVKRTYMLAVEGAQEGFYMVRALFGSNGSILDFLVEDCNERGAEMAELTKEQMIGARFSRMYLGKSAEHLLEALQRAMQTGFHEDEIRMVRRDSGTAFWLHRRLVRSGSGLAVTVRDITEAKEHERQLHVFANTDDLTKLPNRHWFMTTLPQALEHARDEHISLAVMFLDLDGFKLINDTLGHYAGDTLLKLAAARLTAAVRAHDSVVRLGGDEFAVMLEHYQDEDEVSAIAARIAADFRRPFSVAGRDNLVTTSIGISLFPRDGQDSETLLKKADDAMYSVKAERNGGFRIYDHKVYHAIRQRLDMERELAVALGEDQFYMVYQPRVDTMSGNVLGLEALVRWRHPQHGEVSPNSFIPLAESTGHILALGALVIEKVCAQIAFWNAAGLPVVPVSVNVSPKQFNEGKVKTVLSTCLAQHGVRADLIEVEITESAMMGDSDDVVMEINAIRSLGTKVMIDDFGTGYSSLSLLHRLDLDVLKVDRTFTSQLTGNPGDAVFFKAIVSMARSLDMRVVAEGVETDVQWQTLKALACDEIQGYLFSRPLSAEAIPQILQQGVLLPTVTGALAA